MTPRDELRERIARAICEAHDTGAGWDDWAADRQQLYLSMADAALGEVAPVLQALDWYGDESNYDEDGVPGEYVGAATDPETGAFEGECDPDRGATARAALDGTPSLPAGGGDGQPTRPERPTPGDALHDEGGARSFYVHGGELSDMLDAMDLGGVYRFVGEWYTVRWTTDEERADPERLYELFGFDPEDHGIDTSVLYTLVPDEQPDAHLYVSFEAVSSSAGDGPERNGRNEKGAIGTAGDEAREALAHTIHRAIVLASAMTIQKAARGVYAAEMELAQHIAASLSSPLPGEPAPADEKETTR